MNYTDWTPFGARASGYLTAATWGDSRLLVSSTDGDCFLVDLLTRAVAPQRLAANEDGILADLSRCRVPPTARKSGERILLSAATQWPWFYVWTPSDGGAAASDAVHGPVQRVESSADLATIAVGSGKQVLGPNQMHAALELWSVQWSGNRFDAVHYAGLARRLLGVAVYQIVWDPQGAWIAVLTGAKSQDHMFLTMLDASTLGILDVVEIPQFAFAAKLWTDEFGGTLCISTPDGVETRSVDDLRECSWAAFSASVDGPTCVDMNSGTVYTNGCAFDSRGRPVRSFSSLPDCQSLTAVSGGLVGLSAAGILRHWQF